MPSHRKATHKLIQLTMQPSRWEAIRQAADRDGLMVTQFCRRAIYQELHRAQQRYEKTQAAGADGDAAS
jgi:hypothetical protein